MEDEQLREQLMQEMENIQLDESQDQQDEQMLNSQEFQDGMGLVPEQEQQFNQHTFLANSLEHHEPEKVTFLTESELGRPLFNMRFLQDLEDIAKYYLDDICLEVYSDKNKNKIASYFRAKIKNISDSGMSNKGFIQNLNVTKKVDMTRTRKRNLDNLKVGNKSK